MSLENAARKANEAAKIAEKKLEEVPQEVRGVSKAKWFQGRQKLQVKVLEANGLDMKKAYMLDTQEQAEAKYEKWEKTLGAFGWAAGGLKLQNTPKLRDFMKNVAASPKTSDECRLNMLQYAQESAVPYEVLRETFSQRAAADLTPIHELLAGSTFVLEKPRPREKSEELKGRLQKLQEALDKKAYDALVHDVTKKSDYEPEVFSSYKEQLGFGLQVVVTMFTFFAFGYYVFRSQFRDSPVIHAAGGALGLTVAMLLETFLFIVRDAQRTKHEELRSKKTAARSRRFTSTEVPDGITPNPITTVEMSSGGAVTRRAGKSF